MFGDWVKRGESDNPRCSSLRVSGDAQRGEMLGTDPGEEKSLEFGEAGRSREGIAVLLPRGDISTTDPDDAVSMTCSDGGWKEDLLMQLPMMTLEKDGKYLSSKSFK